MFLLVKDLFSQKRIVLEVLLLKRPGTDRYALCVKKYFSLFLFAVQCLTCLMLKLLWETIDLNIIFHFAVLILLLYCYHAILIRLDKNLCKANQCVSENKVAF